MRVLIPGLLLTALSLAAQQGETSRRFALVIGHNVGFADETPLSYAEDDAERFAEVLLSVGGVAGTDMTVLRGPNRAEALAAFRGFSARFAASRDSVALFYFAGHGDDTSLHPGQERLGRDEVVSLLRRMQAKTKVAIIDACQTATVTQRRGVQAGASFDIGVIAPDTPHGMVIVHSSDKGEPALESKELRGALFTHHLISGLRGAADVNRDNRITLNEAYARRLTVLDSAAAADVVQHPSYTVDLKGAEELVLSETTRSRARLILPRSSAARYMVFQHSTALAVAEVEGDSRATQSIAVPAGRLLVQRRQQGRTAVAEIEAPFGGTRALNDSDFHEQPYDTIARRGASMELWPNVLSAAAVGRVDMIDASPVWRVGPGLRYERCRRLLFIGVLAEAMFARYENDFLETTEQAVLLTTDLGWRVRTTALAFSLSLGPLAQLRFQQRERRDAERLTQAGLGDHIETHHTALGLGGGLVAGVSVPLHERLELRLDLDAMLFGEKVNVVSGQAELLPNFSGGASLGFGYRL